MVKPTMQRWLSVLTVLVVMATSSHALAIDHPDAPDRMSEFRQQADQLEAAMLAAPSTAAFGPAAARYQAFLGEQLNQAYQLLQKQLAPAAAEDLKQSQRRWLRFRDQELVFINNNWTPALFGSSSVLSRHHYQASLTRARVEQLLQYLRNYPGS